eukprot:849781-Pyramimonas_sp.AAC.1
MQTRCGLPVRSEARLTVATHTFTHVCTARPCYLMPCSSPASRLPLAAGPRRGNLHNHVYNIRRHSTSMCTTYVDIKHQCLQRT